MKKFPGNILWNFIIIIMIIIIEYLNKIICQKLKIKYMNVKRSIE